MVEGRDEIGLQSRSVLRTLGWSREFFAGKPVIGIANSWSELNNCNLGLRAVAEAVKRGVIAAGGVPLEFNTISLGEELRRLDQRGDPPARNRRPAGVPLALDDFDLIGRTPPLLLDLQPAGARLMANFDEAGGVPALLGRLADQLHLGCLTVPGQSLGAQLALAPPGDPAVIRSCATPLGPAGWLAVLRGNLAPRGTIIRASTASPRLLRHCGRALVFDSYADMLARIEAPDLQVDAESVLILRNAGAVGVPGMPEWGAIPVPKKLLRADVDDLVRISDARMSGTSAGTVVLHVAPEAAIGGPLALVHDGDMVELDVPARSLVLHVPHDELARRRAGWAAPRTLHRRGYPRLYAAHMLQPDEGCDFDFMRPASADGLGMVPPIVGWS